MYLKNFRKWNLRLSVVMAIFTLVACGFALTSSEVGDQIIASVLAAAGMIETIWFAEKVMKGGSIR